MWSNLSTLLILMYSFKPKPKSPAEPNRVVVLSKLYQADFVASTMVLAVCFTISAKRQWRSWSSGGVLLWDSLLIFSMDQPQKKRRSKWILTLHPTFPDNVNFSLFVIEISQITPINMIFYKTFHVFFQHKTAKTVPPHPRWTANLCQPTSNNNN